MRSTFVKSLSLAAILAAPLHADPITDFTELRGWLLSACQRMNLDPLGTPAVNFATICISGPLVFGLRPSTNQYGFIYNFTTSTTGSVPPGASMFAAIEELDFANPFTISLSKLIGSGESFLPTFTQNSTLTSATAFTSGSPARGCCGQDFDTPVAITATAEPGTLTLFATGLAVLVGVRRKSRRR